MFKETHPILGTRDIQRAIAFYTGQLGFKLAFGDKADPPNYIGFRRNAVELHMQFQFEHEMGTIRLRFLVDDPDALFSVALINAEAPSGKRHDDMVASFNRGYLSFQSYRTCTSVADVVVRRYLEEGAKIARDINARYAQ